MAPAASLECVADVKSVLGEGALWVARESALYWLDIKGRKIYRLEGSGEWSEWPTPFRIGSLAPRAGGGFIAGTERGVAAVDLETNRFEPLFHPEEQRRGNRFNDGEVDRGGRYWAGTMHDEEKEASGALYRIDHDLSWQRIDDGYKVTNGPAFSADGRRMYHNDSARQVSYVFALDDDGNASDRRVFARFAESDGYPDGMTVDSEDCLWIAFWDGWCVRRFAPSGECVLKLDMPVQRPTSCAFGGEDMDELYVTSATIGLSAEELREQPCAGGLFLSKPGVRGVPAVPFAG